MKCLCGAKGIEVGFTIIINMISKRQFYKSRRNLAGWRQENSWRIGGVEEKSKIILLFGLDFTRLHQ
jgi:hypothetical protein